MSSLICKCGKQKASTQKKICDDCRNENKKERNKLFSRKRRKTHGCTVNRGILCSRCKGLKENQKRSYCLACERERYYEKDKADCATCGAIKENPRDAYCNLCKSIKNRIKSIAEGRRFKNDEGRKTTCSNCGREKEENYLNESYCKSCKVFKKKLHRPCRTDEQRFKEAVRKVTARAIQQGYLTRSPCEVCCTKEDVQAHHDDYNKPLDVRWLCRKHHQEHHKNNPD